MQSVETRYDRMPNKEDRVLAEWIINDLHNAYPEDLAKYPAEHHLLMAYNGIQRAIKYHFELKASYVLFVECMFMFAPNFDEYPPVKFILGNGQIEHDKKMELIAKEMTDQNWSSIRKRHNNQAWDINDWDLV